MPWRHRIFSHSPQPRPNLTYFGQIRALDPYELRDQLRVHYYPKGHEITRDEYVNDLCSQMVINSRIADRKFKFFDRGAGAVGVGLLFVFFSVCITALRVLF